MINWTTTKGDAKLLTKIARRAVAIAAQHGEEWDYRDVEMDVTAAHANGTPLNLEKLLGFDDFNFMHDVGGIRRHINRSDGGLMNCFVPRSAIPTHATA